MENSERAADKFARHINPTEKIVIDGDEFILKPLTWKYLPKINKLVARMAKKTKSANIKEDSNIEDMTEEQIEAAFGLFDEDNRVLINELCFATMKISYPDVEDSLLEDFVSANAIKLIQPVIKLNMPKQ